MSLCTPYQRQVLLVRPGITGLASIRFRNENDLLTASTDPNRTYIEQIMPREDRPGPGVYSPTPRCFL